MTKNDLLKDIQDVARKFQDENRDSNSYCTRNYYRKFGKYKKFDKYGSFTDLKKEAMEKEGINSDVFEYEKKILLIESENRELKTKYKQLLDQIINEDVILEKYMQELQKGIVLDGKKITLTFKENESEKEAILMLSDFHLGETVNSYEIHGINEYNSEIMMERLNRIFYYFTYYCNMYNIDKIKILFLGDLISGGHHKELIKTQEFTDVEAIFFLQEYLINKLLEIEHHFSNIDVHILVGNHSRIPEGRPEYKKSSILNYEYILAKQIKMFFDVKQEKVDNRKINVHVNDSLFDVIEVAGRRFLITHGHIMSTGSNSFAGIPYYGLSMQASKMDGAFKQFEHLHFSDILMGHLHATSKVKTPIGNIYINGSIIGVAEFALYKMKTVGIPEQTMLVVSDGEINNEITLRGN